jgi:hypothetical protein
MALLRSISRTLLLLSAGSFACSLVAAQTPGARSPVTLQLSESGGPGLQLVFPMDADGHPLSGRFEWRAWRCTGGYRYAGKRDGELILQQYLENGNCVRGCQIHLSEDLSSYREICAGRQELAGRLSGAEHLSTARRAADPGAQADTSAPRASAASSAPTPATERHIDRATFDALSRPSEAVLSGQRDCKVRLPYTLEAGQEIWLDKGSCSEGYATGELELRTTWQGEDLIGQKGQWPAGHLDLGTLRTGWWKAAIDKGLLAFAAVGGTDSVVNWSVVPIERHRGHRRILRPDGEEIVGAFNAREPEGFLQLSFPPGHRKLPHTFGPHTGRFEGEGADRRFVVRGYFDERLSMVTHCASPAECERHPKVAPYATARQQRALKLARDRDDVQRCRGATVEAVLSLGAQPTEFYGQCRGERAVTGIALRKEYGLASEMLCVKDGRVVSRGTIERFEDCEDYLAQVPGTCKAGDYRGQCRDGKPHGVGHEGTRSGNLLSGTTIKIRGGQFVDGELHGFGYRMEKGGCGPAGCSGELQEEIGWFDKGRAVLSCPTVAQCLAGLSGEALTERLRQQAKLDPGPLQAQRAAARQGDFDQALLAFKTSGDADDLRQANALARSRAQRAHMELELMRLAGFDRALRLSGVVRSGAQSASLGSEERLLGLWREVNSRLPVTLDWKLEPNPGGLKLQHGRYRVDLTVGVAAEYERKACMMGVCQTHRDVREHVHSPQVTIDPGGRFQQGGSHALAVTGSSITQLIADQSYTLTGVRPILRIHRVELLAP